MVLERLPFSGTWSEEVEEGRYIGYGPGMDIFKLSVALVMGEPIKHEPIGDWGALPKTVLKRTIEFLEQGRYKHTLGQFRLVNRHWSGMVSDHLTWLRPRRHYPFKQEIVIQKFANLQCLELLEVKLCPGLLCSGFSTLKHVKTLMLWKNSIESEGMEIIWPGLQSCKQLSDVNIRDNFIRDKGCECLAKALMRKENLKTLTIWSAGIGDSGMRHLTGILHEGSNLKLLDLRGNRVSSVGAGILASCLREGIALTRIVLAGNHICTQGLEHFASALRRPTNLRLLDVGGCRVGDEGVVELAQALQGPNKLQSLVLTWNELTNVSGSALAAALGEGANIRCLDVRDNCIMDEGIRDLIESAKTARSLRKLGVRFNPMSSEFLSSVRLEIAQIKASKGTVVYA